MLQETATPASYYEAQPPRRPPSTPSPAHPPPPAQPPKAELPLLKVEHPKISGTKTASRYYYPPRQRLPLPKCFYNPTGYVCCNEELNNLMVKTFSEMEARPKFHTCNVRALANVMQDRLQNRFNDTFETIVAYDDFAQKVHFRGDLICKVELGGRYMLAYAAARSLQESELPPLDALNQLGPVDETHHNLNKRRTIRI
ncbi:ground-like domain protein [Necator americanus]|uniref:Ground-like domain protein n=1 Tax=Necator americanus TaxID=51031 RepID=W2TNL6_NECAM|nr:ground-like domain protein [Necator americanus]ETN82607.1 ground-like domain protein [Necator americanus]